MFFFLSLAFTTSAYVLHRRTREDNPDEHDVWAFNETKTIESLGVTNDGILSVSLRGRSLCFSWVCGLCGYGCGCVVVVVKKATEGGLCH